jgi:hypothetical protein
VFVPAIQVAVQMPTCSQDGVNAKCRSAKREFIVCQVTGLTCVCVRVCVCVLQVCRNVKGLQCPGLLRYPTEGIALLPGFPACPSDKKNVKIQVSTQRRRNDMHKGKPK